MKLPEAFHLGRTPLLPGTTLIEASAGTGKTFTIAGLFLRLLLERDCSVREILVVTFTEAATEELRGRVRDRLLEAAAALLAGGETADEVLREILQPHLARRDEMLARLDRALRGFDETPIFTIHGFCQRTLRDRAFESGALFDTELLKDDSRLLEEIADDFWRRHFYEANALPVQFVLANNYRPERFLPLLRLRNRHPMLQVVSAVDHTKASDLLNALEQTFERAQDLWRSDETGIRHAFGDTAWAKGDYAKPEIADTMWRALAECFDECARTPDSLEALSFFAASALTKNTRIGGTKPAHLFFQLCDDIERCERNFLAGLDLEFLKFAEAELPRRKQQRKVVCFDDLLTRLYEALRSDGGPALAAEVRAKYRAALIDEFQDTDRVQYEIFREIFAIASSSDDDTQAIRFESSAFPLAPALSCSGGAREEQEAASRAGVSPAPVAQRPNSSGAFGAGQANCSPCVAVPAEGNRVSIPPPLLFLIGDPKQAIYSFRGADMFAYIDAAEAADRSYTLGRNFRSESGLVRAVNTLFASVEQSFLFADIRFQPVDASDRADRAPLTENGETSPPLRVWFMPRDGEALAITKEHAEEVLPQIVATEIARLLNTDTRLGDVKLSPRDIAVLVPENRHARLMQEALRARQVPSVLFTEESVFASREARELQRVLAAVAQPANERLIRAALATDLLGVDGAQLDQLIRDEAGWQLHLERFADEHATWRENGFTPMFRQWLQTRGVRQRLLKFTDGERRLTNLLHLAEVLHQAAVERRLALNALVRWLSEQIVSDEKADEEHQLRLERDDQAVKLVTIHKSKGLEYPIVFCPFSWKSSDLRRDEPVLFHERPEPVADGRRAATQLYWDLGTDEIEVHRELAAEERLAENLRLLYVALTRARNRCYFVWGAFRGAGTSAAAWLLHPTSSIDPSRRGATNAHFTTLTDAAMQADLQKLVERSTDGKGCPAIQWQPLPKPDEQPFHPRTEVSEPLRSRPFTGQIARDWGILSFSALAADRSEELPDNDAAPEPTLVEESAAPAEGIFGFPRGTNAGTCLHKILEALDFTSRDDAVLRDLVRSQLIDHGLQPDLFAETACAAIRRTLAVPLTSGDPKLVLASVSMNQRLNELEFFFPVERLTPALLQSAFASPNSSRELQAQLRRLDFQPTGGFVKGFIDLVFRHEGRFYILDWKSNWLGNRVEDYGPDSLAREMAENLYTLQYHLYTVALHRYVKLRLHDYDYDTHFGGVRYLFLRGLDPARPEFGIFRARPEAAWVKEFSAQLAGAGEGL